MQYLILWDLCKLECAERMISYYFLSIYCTE